MNRMPIAVSDPVTKFVESNGTLRLGQNLSPANPLPTTMSTKKEAAKYLMLPEGDSEPNFTSKYHLPPRSMPCDVRAMQYPRALVRVHPSSERILIWAAVWVGNCDMLSEPEGLGLSTMVRRVRNDHNSRSFTVEIGKHIGCCKLSHLFP